MISRKFRLSLVIAVVAATIYVAMPSLNQPKPIVVFSAPTLRGVSDAIIRLSSEPVDIQVHGSVLAANLIRSGRVPDIFLSVDSELKHNLPYRKEYILGIYRLVLVCDRAFTSLDALKSARVGFADPNQAPIGYRALAAFYIIASQRFPEVLDELRLSLNVRYEPSGDALEMDLSGISPSGRFFMRPNLDGVGVLLESKAVDCIFAHYPFILYRDYTKKYNIIEVPQDAGFEIDLPIKIVARLKSGEVVVRRLEAIAISFTERGDKILELLKRLDVADFGIKPLGE